MRGAKIYPNVYRIYIYKKKYQIYQDVICSKQFFFPQLQYYASSRTRIYFEQIVSVYPILFLFSFVRRVFELVFVNTPKKKKKMTTNDKNILLQWRRFDPPQGRRDCVKRTIIFPTFTGHWNKKKKTYEHTLLFRGPYCRHCTTPYDTVIHF